MTHSDIYTKFMIEYDKANITSSYPSLTKYEVATILDKAYLALIAEKFTGNNPRRSTFEADIKAIEDLRPLITDESQFLKKGTYANEYNGTYPSNSLYYVDGYLQVNNDITGLDKTQSNDHTHVHVSLVSRGTANRFKATNYNMPWIKEPVCTISGNTISVYIDQYDYINNSGSLKFIVTYIKNPNKFAVGKGTSASDYDFGSTKYELSDTMAEEMINLAIIIATEIVESSRLTSKTNTRPLEA